MNLDPLIVALKSEILGQKKIIREQQKIIQEQKQKIIRENISDDKFLLVYEQTLCEQWKYLNHLGNELQHERESVISSNNFIYLL